ncbi:MAG TPA: hypothetical protein ENH88_17530, partial [Pseudoalteromonas prydzensis]
MDDVIGLIVILSLVVVAGSIAGLIALTKVSTLKQEVAALKKQLHAVIANNASQQQTQPHSVAQTVQSQVARPIELARSQHA